MTQDKGQINEVQGFINTILKGESPVIPIDEIFSSAMAALKVEESLRIGRPVVI